MRKLGARPPAPGLTVSLVSLGCAKNTVDSERILGALVTDGFLVAEDPREADLCLVNTCGFIGDAREEARQTLAELAALKNRHGRPRLVALGCLVQRTKQRPELAPFLEAADARLDFGAYTDLPALCRSLCADAQEVVPDVSGDLSPAFHRAPRLLTGATHAVPLKISEGCANRCRFCTIPAIRGPQVSRPIEEIVREAEELLASGAREIDLIAQDTTAYGKDLYGRRSLADLLRALTDVETDAWFRLMYAYPGHLDEETLDVLASDVRFCPYLDLPIQHISDRILKAMGRKQDRDNTVRLLERLPERWPGLEMRTAFIVGFPGETDAEFEELRAFAEQGRFLYAGVFAYSREAGTPAARLPDPVPLEIREIRRAALADTITRATERRLRAYLGQTLDVMVDRKATGEERAIGLGWVARTRFQAPEVDGVVRLRSRKRLQPGQVIEARITDACGVDLAANPTKSGNRQG